MCSFYYVFWDTQGEAVGTFTGDFRLKGRDCYQAFYFLKVFCSLQESFEADLGAVILYQVVRQLA